MKERIVLLDNGSLKPEAVFSLRRIARDLGARIGREVEPVSLLHSSKIPAGKLDGVAAQTWRRFLKARLADGSQRIRVAPLFFGPSLAIVDYLPKVTGEMLGGDRSLEVEIGAPLAGDGPVADVAVAAMLADLLLRGPLEAAGGRTRVILVDHGSPAREVAACRDQVAAQLGTLLGAKAEGVIAASMERREGEEYAFNEPLLHGALEQAREQGAERVALALMFFSPGRHAGPGGDIARIVAESRFARQGGRVDFAPLAGESPLLIDLLARRYRAMSGPRCAS